MKDFRNYLNMGMCAALFAFIGYLSQDIYNVYRKTSNPAPPERIEYYTNSQDKGYVVNRPAPTATPAPKLSSYSRKVKKEYRKQTIGFREGMLEAGMENDSIMVRYKKDDSSESVPVIGLQPGVALASMSVHDWDRDGIEDAAFHIFLRGVNIPQGAPIGPNNLGEHRCCMLFSSKVKSLSMPRLDNLKIPFHYPFPYIY